MTLSSVSYEHDVLGFSTRITMTVHLHLESNNGSPSHSP